MKNSRKSKKFLISPSLLSSDFSRLKDEVSALEEAGADWIHFDVMDGHFVSNLTFGAKVLESLRPLTNLPIDVHLMIENPKQYYNDFISAGANYLTLHFETLTEKKENQKLKVHQTKQIRNKENPKALAIDVLSEKEENKREIEKKSWIFEEIRKKGAFPGITLKPVTDINHILPFLHLVDLVLVMTVEPGFGGQTFMKNQVSKIDSIDQYRKKFELSLLIEVDGGINIDTAKLCKKADVLVAGSYIFSTLRKNINKAPHNLLVKTYSKAIESLKEINRHSK